MGFARTLVVGSTAVVAIYYVPAGYHVAMANNEERSIKVRMKEELDAALAAEKEASEQKSAIQALELKAQEEQSTVASLNAQLEEARKHVVTLEADSKSAMEKSIATLDQIDKGRISLRSLLAQAAKHRETAEVAKEAMAEAKIRSQDARMLLNPLNHPVVRSAISK